MLSQGKDTNYIVLDAVNNSVFLVDATGIPASQPVFEYLGFSNSGGRAFSNSIQQFFDFLGQAKLS